MTPPALRVFRMARWYKIFSVLATLMLCAAGTYYFVSGTNIWYRAGGVAFIIFGLAALADVLVSRIILDEDAIHLVSLVRRRSYPRAHFWIRWACATRSTRASRRANDFRFR